jgi:multidrug efflux pump subunit AcrB
MSAFFRFFAERHLLAYLITFSIIALGLSALTHIKRDTFPEVEFGEVFVTTAFPGASPEDVELKVTNKIETELKQVTGIRRFMSWSKENNSIIHIVIDPDVRDEEKVIREIREAVNRVTDFPPEVTEAPLITELTTSVFPIIEVGVAAEGMPYRELREIARRFEKRLENVAGVSHVERYGYRAREVRIEVDPDKLIKKDISLFDIIEAIGARNIRATGGSFESYTSEKNIVTLAQFTDAQEVGDVIVRTTFSGPLIKVKDLAIIKDDFEEERVMSRVNGVSAISFVAYKRESADIIRTVEAVKALVEKERKHLPEGVRLLYSNDQSTSVRNRLSIVVFNGALGLAFVMVVLSLFMSRRVAFWVALGVPISILGVIFLLPIFGTFLDSIALTAMVLVIGIIVDDAIIISESIYTQYENGASPLDAAVNGVTEVFKPVLTTILTTFVVFLPMFFMPGIMGKFVYVIPLVITLALLVSLIESTLALPAHLTSGLAAHHKRKGEERSEHLFHTVREAYSQFLNWLLRFRYVMVVGFAAALGGTAFYGVKYMEFIMFPTNTAERFAIFAELETGTSLEATADKVQELEKLVADLGPGELASYVTRIGTYGDVVANESENYAAIWVTLTPFATRDRIADEIVEGLRDQTDKLDGYVDIRYMVDTGGPPVGRPINLRVVGEDDGERKRLADDMVAFLKTVDGAQDIDRDDKPGKQEIQLKLDYTKLSRFGLTVEDVARAVRIAYDGQVVTNVRYGEEDVDFRVIFSPQARRSMAYLKKLEIRNRQNQRVPLRHAVRLETGVGPSNIHHFDGERAITVTGDIDKDVTTALGVSEQVVGKFDPDQDYPGVRIQVGGEAEETKKSFADLMSVFLIAIIGVYFLLILLFNSVWQPIMVMMAVPFGIVGVIVAFALHDQPLGFLAVTGVIGLAGVVVNDSLVLVNHVNELRRRFPDMGARELVARGTADRLRAIVLTTVSTVAGLLPLAYGIGGSDPYMSPMALALGYGLLFATPLTLVLVPCLYVIGDDIGRLFRRSPVTE